MAVWLSAVQRPETEPLTAVSPDMNWMGSQSDYVRTTANGRLRNLCVWVCVCVCLFVCAYVRGQQPQVHAKTTSRDGKGHVHRQMVRSTHRTNGFKFYGVWE